MPYLHKCTEAAKPESQIATAFSTWKHIEHPLLLCGRDDDCLASDVM